MVGRSVHSHPSPRHGGRDRRPISPGDKGHPVLYEANSRETTGIHRRLEVYRHRESHAKEGAIVGAVVGIILPLTFILVRGDGYDDEPDLVALGAIVLSPVTGLLGACTGFVIGGMLGQDVWKAVDLSPSTVEGRRRLSYRLSFRF